MNTSSSVETWKPIPDFEGLYEVSDHGRVRSLDRILITESTHPGFGSITRKYKGKILKAHAGKDYPRVNLQQAGKNRFVRVHILVLEVFVGSKPIGKECCHRDDNRENNHVSNLYWGTRSDNLIDNFRNHPGRGAEYSERARSFK